MIPLVTTITIQRGDQVVLHRVGSAAQPIMEWLATPGGELCVDEHHMLAGWEFKTYIIPRKPQVYEDGL